MKLWPKRLMKKSPTETPNSAPRSASDESWKRLETQVDEYVARAQHYAAKAESVFAAQFDAATINSLNYSVAARNEMLGRAIRKKLDQERSMKKLFTVFECDNGFIAEMGDNGQLGTVVGMTMSDVSEAAQRALATAKLKQEDEPADSAKQDDGRVQRIAHSMGNPVKPVVQPSNRFLDTLFK